MKKRCFALNTPTMKAKPTKAAVAPLGLVQQDSRLYLICRFEHFDNVVHLALHRFKRAEVTDFPAVRPRDFDLQGYVNDRHFNFSNGAWIHWILEFESDQTARNLTETPFNTSQVLEKREDGIWHLEVDIQDSMLLDGWVAMWKEKARHQEIGQAADRGRYTGEYRTKQTAINSESLNKIPDSFLNLRAGIFGRNRLQRSRKKVPKKDYFLAASFFSSFLSSFFSSFFSSGLFS